MSFWTFHKLPLPAGRDGMEFKIADYDRRQYIILFIGAVHISIGIKSRPIFSICCCSRYTCGKHHRQHQNKNDFFHIHAFLLANHLILNILISRRIQNTLAKPGSNHTYRHFRKISSRSYRSRMAEKCLFAPCYLAKWIFWKSIASSIRAIHVSIWIKILCRLYIWCCRPTRRKQHRKQQNKNGFLDHIHTF